MELTPQSYYVVQGYIDAKDDRGRSVNGTFISLVTRRNVKFTSVLFDHHEMDKSMSWRDLLPLHEEASQDSNKDPLMVHHEEGLFKYLETSLLLTSIPKNLNAKQAEQAVSRFCLEHLKLKAVCFISFDTTNEEDLKVFHADVPVQQPQAETQTPAPEVEPAGETDEKPSEGKRGDVGDIFVRCEPVLDPVGGVALNELAQGDNIYGRLTPDSIIYKLLARNNSKFDGIIITKVTGILVNDLGTATVSLILSDGVAGVMKLSGKVKVKTAPDPETAGKTGSGAAKRLSLFSVPPEFIFAAAGILVVISALLALYYIFPL